MESTLGSRPGAGGMFVRGNVSSCEIMTGGTASLGGVPGASTRGNAPSTSLSGACISGGGAQASTPARPRC